MIIQTTNNRGGQLVAETEKLQRPYWEGASFTGTVMEAYCTQPTVAHIIKSLESTIEGWDDSRDEGAVWDIRCHYMAIHLIKSLKAE